MRATVRPTHVRCNTAEPLKPANWDNPLDSHVWSLAVIGSFVSAGRRADARVEPRVPWGSPATAGHARGHRLVTPY